MQTWAHTGAIMMTFFAKEKQLNSGNATSTMPSLIALHSTSIILKICSQNKNTKNYNNHVHSKSQGDLENFNLQHIWNFAFINGIFNF